jgi:hypothetical protein
MGQDVDFDRRYGLGGKAKGRWYAGGYEEGRIDAERSFAKTRHDRNCTLVQVVTNTWSDKASSSLVHFRSPKMRLTDDIVSASHEMKLVLRAESAPQLGRGYKSPGSPYTNRYLLLHL